MVDSFMHMDVLRQKNVGHVIIKQVMELKPIVYRYTYKTPIRLRYIQELKDVGKSSAIFHCNLYDADTGTWLGKNDLKFVQINTKTRRSLPFPDWFQREFSDLSVYGKFEDFNRTPIPETPVDCYKWTTELRHSDYDKNYHANQATYVKLCMDCATKASLAGYFRFYKEDMCLFNVNRFVITYNGESFVDEKLEICCWQDTEDECKIMFSFLKNKKQIVFAEFIFGRERFNVLTSPKL